MRGIFCYTYSCGKIYNTQENKKEKKARFFSADEVSWWTGSRKKKTVKRAIQSFHLKIMFKKENRLVPGIRFGNSYFLSIPQFILKERKNGLGVNRFGIVVSKKIDKRAVGRNRIKRFLRTALMSLYEKMNAGHDILFIVKKGILDKTKEENLNALERALEKAEIIRVND